MRTWKVCVLGQGVSGLSSALSLKESFPHLEITVIGHRDFSEITSSGPPGLFRPHEGSEPSRKKWLKDTYERITELYQGTDAESSGISRVSGYLFSDEREFLDQIAEGSEIVDQFSWLSDKEMKNIAVIPRRYGVGFTSYTMLSRSYVPYLESQLKKKGVKFEKRKISSFAELKSQYDVVINCTGLGSRHLCNDPSIRPVRGVLIEVDAPWVKHFCFDGSDALTYVIPGRKTVFLGGLRQLDRYDTKITDSDREEILGRCYRIMPSLRRAKIVREWCGLRPYRPQIRLELEPFQCSDGSHLPVDAPWVKHFCFDGSDALTYVIPGRKTVFLGGLRQLDRYDTKITDSDREEILGRCYRIMPSLRRAKIVREWCGLRPYRPQIRLELEPFQCSDGSHLPVIHNYGHGGAGFLLSWGCARHVSRLFHDLLPQPSKL